MFIFCNSIETWQIIEREKNIKHTCILIEFFMWTEKYTNKKNLKHILWFFYSFINCSPLCTHIQSSHVFDHKFSINFASVSHIVGIKICIIYVYVLKYVGNFKICSLRENSESFRVLEIAIRQPTFQNLSTKNIIWQS